MKNGIILAGFGGQGILFAGKLLAQTGMFNGKKVTWLPSYGPEMRGGTASCTVIISDSEIGSPITPNPDFAVVLNMPSYLKFEPAVKTGGTLIFDGSMLHNVGAGRNDINKVDIPATALANEHGLPGFANVIAIGKFVSQTQIFTPDELFNTLEHTIPESKKSLLELNKKAFNLGYNRI